MTPRRFELRASDDDDFDRQVFADVAEHGWHDTHVLEDVPFNFTVGLYYSYGHPELLVQGLELQVPHKVLWNAVREFQRTGTAFSDGSETDALFNGVRARFRTIPIAAYRPNLGTAMRFYAPIWPESFPALQVVWPDKQGRFPGDPACDPATANCQTLLLD